MSGRAMLAVLAVAAAAAPAAPARAQQTETAPSPAGGACDAEARPAVGGGSFNSAPVLAPGGYQDTLLAGETLFYGVRLAPGQQLDVGATIDISTGARLHGGTPRAATALVIVDAYSPLRQDLVGTRDLGSFDPEAEVVTARTAIPTVLPPDEAVTEDRAFDAYTGPGTYYVAINLSESVYDLGPRVELPMELCLDVSGGASTEGGAGSASRAEDPLALPGGAGAPPGRASRSERRVAGDQDDGGRSTVALAAAGGGGLLAGAALGAAGAALWRRRPA